MREHVEQNISEYGHFLRRVALKHTRLFRRLSVMTENLYYHSLKYDFKKKAHHFNVLFALKFTPLINNSVIPDLLD